MASIPWTVQRLYRSYFCAIVITVSMATQTGVLVAGEVQLKNGISIEGKPVPIQSLTSAVTTQSGELQTYPMLLIDTGMQRYFVPQRQVLNVDQSAELSRNETFKLSQRRIGGGKILQQVGRFLDVTPFDEFGRRRVTLSVSGQRTHVIQGITEIGPEYLKVMGLSHGWSHGVATSSVPPEELDAMLRTATSQENPNDRLSIAAFYLQAGLYTEAQNELDAVAKDFPELGKRVEQLTFELRTLLGKRLVGELNDRRSAGQHQLAYRAAQQFPTKNLSATVLRDVKLILADYDESREKVARALLRLGELQSQVEDQKLLVKLDPMRSEINEQLNFEALSRLDAFLQLEADKSLKTEEKLALAYSGWVVGSANAVTVLDTAIQYWRARFLALEYLRSNDEMSQRLLATRLQQLESIGPTVIAHLIPFLPPIVESPGVEPGKIALLNAATGASDTNEAAGIQYSVLLPPEYTYHRAYPLIVALHPAERSAEKEIIWWGGTEDKPAQSARHGYIVIAPHYATEGQHEHDYSPASHKIVLAAMRDAMRRFRIDNDRVFLSGHGMGGDAAFDLGMSHPDIFAGVIPITGISDLYCKYYWENARHVAWYIVGGELDRDSMERNSRELNRMLKHGYDMIYSEYIGRGYESYYAEIHKLFAWMDLHRRAPAPESFEYRILRPQDNEFYWAEFSGMPKNVTNAVIVEGRNARVRPMVVSINLSTGLEDRTVVHVSSGADNTTLWLSPEVIDFEKRLTVRHAGRQKFNDFLRPSMKTILDDYYRRADRKRFAWAKLSY